MIYTWNLDPVALSIMGLKVHWYGLSYLAGFFIAIHLGRYLWNRYSQNPEVEKDIFESFVFSTFLAGIIGGRLGLFLFYAPQTLWQDPLQIFQVWEGGMSIHGGLIGATLWGLWQCKKNNWNPLKVSDVFILPLAIGLFFGRIANFVNGELYGRPTDQTWGVIFPHIDELLRHPSQLYEASKNLLIAAILWTAIKKHGFQRPGLLTAIMLVGYGVLRFLIEYVREPEIYFGPLTMGQALCVAMITIGAGIFWLPKLRSNR